jgi:hypothetical protein
LIALCRFCLLGEWLVIKKTRCVMHCEMFITWRIQIAITF